MAGTSGFDPDRIYVQLNNTALQQKDSRLYQVIYQMIQELARLRVDSSSSSSGGGGSTSNITNVNQFLDLLSGSGDSSSDNFPIPGRDGLNGRDGLIGPPGLDDLDSSDLSPLGFNINNNSSEITITTTGNIDDLDFGNVSLIRMDNASLSTIRGLKAGYAGQTVTIVSVGAGQVDLAHQNNNSSAGNRFINFATSGNSSLAAGFGNCSYRYDGTTARWRLVVFNQGDWIDVPYSAGNFTANGSLVWTVDSGDQLVFKYWLKDKALIINLGIANSTLSGVASNELIVAIPGGFITLGAFNTNTTFLCYNGVVDVGGYMYTNSVGQATFFVLKITGANWTTIVNSVNVFGTGIIGVQ